MCLGAAGPADALENPDRIELSSALIQHAPPAAAANEPSTVPTEPADLTCAARWLAYYICMVTSPASDCSRPNCMSPEEAVGADFAQMLRMAEMTRIH